MTDQALWYAVHIRSNREQQVHELLQRGGVVSFLPCYRVRSSRRDRVVHLQRPLFPGYLFVRLIICSDVRIRVLRTPGVVRFVGFTDGPVPLPERVMESLFILTGGDDHPARPHPLVKAGSRVRVASGPFCGATGVLHRMDGHPARLVVEVSFLGRAVAVPIETDQVMPVSASD
jgi:transcription antitermination factor NusG